MSQTSVRIPINGIALDGDLVVPSPVQGIVIFAHGSGSSRHSSRNRHVAEALQQLNMATLLLDLLTPAEERVDAASGALRFDIQLLAARLVAATEWARHERAIAHLPVGYFGASTGAGAALVAAANLAGEVRAVVSRGGRPDLAGTEALGRVETPTLLIVGGADTMVVPLNQRALRHLRGTKELIIVPGATHLFEEPGALEEVARLAGEWFVRYLVPASETVPNGEW